MSCSDAEPEAMHFILTAAAELGLVCFDDCGRIDLAENYLD